MPVSDKKKYTLFASATSESGKQPCAFFVSAKGCRNGDNCKFSHEKPHEIAGVTADAMVSSESEASDHEREEVSKNTTPSDLVIQEESPFVKSASLHTIKAAKTAPKSTNDKKSKPKKKREEEHPFAAPQSKKQKHEETAKPKSKKLQQEQTISPIPAKKDQTSSKSAPPKLGKTSVIQSFRSLDLPIASFQATISPHLEKSNKVALETKSIVNKTPKPAVPGLSDAPLPTSTPTGQKWLALVQKTREHPRYLGSYNMEKYKAMDEEAGYSSNTWIKIEKPFDASLHTELPHAIAIDCEMCETKDPVSGNIDARALCRISVVDVETDEVLLDSLVKPSLPVSDHRTWVNGITPEHLDSVQFTLRHAQAFFMALLTTETVVMGHAVHNDLAALRIEHFCVVDSACLFVAEDSPAATVALRDLATTLLQTEMPSHHDSVLDSRIAFQCLEYYRQHEGNVPSIVRTARPVKNNAESYARQLFVHRIPKDVCNETQLAAMFLAHTNVQAVSVDTIEYTSGGKIGKTVVHFSSGRHGDLAFDTLEGKAVADASGRLQKKVYLRKGDYIRVRKMAFERSKDKKISDTPSNNPNESETRQRRTSN